MTLVVYGDFNCPYSRLASLRVDRLLADGARVDWRAVQHDPAMPKSGVIVDDELRAELDREVEEIRGLLTRDEEVTYVYLPVRPNTAEDCVTLAGSDVPDEFRRDRFDEIWGGRSPSSCEPVADGAARAIAQDWQRAWESFAQRMVPLLVEDEGDAPRTRVHRGVAALRRLATISDLTGSGD